MDEKVIEARTGLMNLYKGVYTANSGVGRQALARIDNTLANLRIRNNNLQQQRNKYKEVIEEVREYAKSHFKTMVADEEAQGLLQILDKVKGE